MSITKKNILPCLIGLLMVACSGEPEKKPFENEKADENLSVSTGPINRDLEQIRADGVLKAITIFSPTSYVLYRGQPLGFEYELLTRLADHLGLKLEIVVAENMNTGMLLNMLNSGEGDIIAHFNSSWVTRVKRDDLLTLHVDGTKGSAVAGLRECYTQSYEETPVPVWNPDIPQPINFFDQWNKVEDGKEYDNAFKVQWELYLKHVVKDDPFPWDLLEGAKGVQLAQLGLDSWEERCWLNVNNLS